MTKFQYVALNDEGGQMEGIVNADSSEHAIHLLKEQGLVPAKITLAEAQSDRAEREARSAYLPELRRLYSYGSRIRLRKFLVFYLPLLIDAGLAVYLINCGWPWLAFFLASAIMVGFTIWWFVQEARMLEAFKCPQCQNNLNCRANRNDEVLYDCPQCEIRWDIGYQQPRGD